MKKLFAAACALALLFALCGCNAKAPDPTASTSGYIAQRNGLYYFLNGDDQNKLYQMDENLKNRRRLSDLTNTAPWLAAMQWSGNKLFYLQTTRPEKGADVICTLYCYDLTWHKEMKVLDGPISCYALDNHWIYFTTDTASWAIYKARLDGSHRSVLYTIDDFMSPWALQMSGNRLYYCRDEEIFEMNPLTGKLADSWGVYPLGPMLVDGQWIYCVREDTQEHIALYKFNTTDPDAENHGVKILSGAGDFSIAGENLYYAVYSKRSKTTNIYRADINGQAPQWITAGSSPIVLGNYLFYWDLNSKMAWKRVKAS